MTELMGWVFMVSWTCQMTGTPIPRAAKVASSLLARCGMNNVRSPQFRRLPELADRVEVRTEIPRKPEGIPGKSGPHMRQAYKRIPLDSTSCAN